MNTDSAGVLTVTPQYLLFPGDYKQCRCSDSDPHYGYFQVTTDSAGVLTVTPQYGYFQVTTDSAGVLTVTHSTVISR